MLTITSKWQAWSATVATILLAASFAIMEMILILTLQVRVPLDTNPTCIADGMTLGPL